MTVDPGDHLAWYPMKTKIALSATDGIVLGFLAWLAGVVVARHPDPGTLLACMGAVAAATLGAALCAQRAPEARAVHDFLPVAVVIALFELLGPVIPAVNAARWDDTFAALDLRLFGRLPDHWFGLLGRPSWLADVAALAYVAYYLVPVVIAAALYRTRRRDEFQEFALTIVGTLLSSYAGYLFFPTAGPRLDPTDAAILGGGALTRGVMAFVEAAEGNQLDAFPSGHTAVSLVTLALGWRFYPRWRAALALVVAGIVFSTVYLSFHYVVDLVAGAALALGVLLVRPVYAYLLPTGPPPRAAFTARRRRRASVRTPA